jgi:hypothetical protein
MKADKVAIKVSLLLSKWIKPWCSAVLVKDYCGSAVVMALYKNLDYYYYVANPDHNH